MPVFIVKSSRFKRPSFGPAGDHALEIAGDDRRVAAPPLKRLQSGGADRESPLVLLQNGKPLDYIRMTARRGSKIDWTSAAKDALLWVPAGGHGHR